MGILDYIIQLVSGKKQTKKSEDTASGDSFVWCLVGNIIDEHFEGEEKILRKGTKHFRAGSKVYCFPPKGEGNFDKVKVLGKHRKSKRTICIVMPSEHIVDWHIQKVSQPYILKMMELKNGWTNSDKDKQAILGMLKWLPNAKIAK
jgi:hypothetical protein